MKNSLNTLTQDYLDDILVRFAHHSAGIEGNTISLPATVSIIVNGTLPMSGKATVREFYEIENHKQAFKHIIEHVSNNDSLTVEIVKEIHADLMDRLQYDRGQFKKSENRILGAEFQTASPAETPTLMLQLLDNLQYRIHHSFTEDDQLLAMVDTHIQFERIHPFSDGNGRTGRLVLNYSLLQNGFPPLIIEKEMRAEYIDFLGNQDVEGFFQFSKEHLLKEQKRMQIFQDMQRERIEYD
ncbi:Fic family protein (plasmid) [Jeotgalibaca sp. MA1X17-3]|uniref:Fic family protein n=1 Tax=Jeotgalibaca sp. MA1X17-3 TaxID=2908211 RepID=UPI001F33576D|nr:Fic family protein [Jeotgalibaca sp. MA1X17-3]UJF16776.1 Fic family protein [Jeotgalibaca sp. MA1X17-3]